MSYLQPSIKIDLKKIEHNAKTVTSACNSLGIEVAGVVKATLGSSEVARAMVAGGVSMIADSRLQNLERLKSLGVPLMMLRQSMGWETSRVVELTEVCLVSELNAVRRLSIAAAQIGKQYKVVVMVETGDLREGVLPSELFDFMQKAMRLPNIVLHGIASNVACLHGIPPTPAMLELLTNSAKRLREQLEIELPAISGGNSSAWKLIESGAIPKGINQFRFGEAILLGQETINFDPIPNTYQDAITIEAEIIEVREKPVPFNGGDPRKRALLAIGVQDICRGELKPLDKKAQVLRRSSDHLVIDVTESEIPYKVGDIATFIPDYEAMLAAMTSPFVEVRYEGLERGIT